MDWVGLLAVAARDCPACGFDCWCLLARRRLALRELLGLRGLEDGLDVAGVVAEDLRDLRRVLLEALVDALVRRLADLRVLGGRRELRDPLVELLRRGLKLHLLDLLLERRVGLLHGLLEG